MSRDRLVEIQTWLNAGPRLGCLLCVGKVEDIRWLTAELKRLTAILEKTPTHSAVPTIGDAGRALAWNQMLNQVVAGIATAFVFARRDGADAYSIERRVIDAVRKLRR